MKILKKIPTVGYGSGHNSFQEHFGMIKNCQLIFRAINIFIVTHHGVCRQNIFPTLANKRGRSTFMPGKRIMAATYVYLYSY